MAKQLFLGRLVARGPVAADAHAEETRPAALALGLPDGVEATGAHPFQVAVAALARERGRQGILRAHVLAAAALEDETDIGGVAFVLVPVEDRAAWPQVVAGVLAGDAIDGVLAEVA